MPSTLHDFSARDIQGRPRLMAEWQGKVVLVVNVASRCVFTPQYEALQKLHDTYADRGFAVLGFPCDQFGHQEPGDEAQIMDFCQTHFSVDFPMFEKIMVNGEGAHPLFAWLTTAAPGILGSRAIKWNFTKFLVDGQGHVVHRYAPSTSPARIARRVERLLGA